MLAAAAGIAAASVPPAAAPAPSAAAISAPSTAGRIRGRVIDRTAPAHPVAHQRVRLTIVERGASSEQEATSDGGGRFAFAGLPVGGVRVFVLGTDYRGVRYASDQVVLAPGAPARDADVLVYEPSPDRSAVRGTVAFAVVDVAPGAIRLSIIQDVGNASDRTVLVSPDDPLAFPLPPGAQRVTPIAGWRNPHVGRGAITDAFPLLPGGARVAYAYGLAANTPRVTVSWAFPYGATDVEVLLPPGRVRLDAPGLTAQGMVASPGGRYLRWSGGPLGRGGQLELTLRGLPTARDRSPAAVAVGLGVVLCLGLAAALRRRAGSDAGLRQDLAGDPSRAASRGAGPAPVEEPWPVSGTRRAD